MVVDKQRDQARIFDGAQRRYEKHPGGSMKLLNLGLMIAWPLLIKVGNVTMASTRIDMYKRWTGQKEVSPFKRLNLAILATHFV